MNRFNDMCTKARDSVQETSKRLEKPSYHMTRFGAIVRATVYGNDYFKGLKGVSDGTLEPLMAVYDDDELGLFRYLCVTYPDFLPLYQRVENIYYDAPVFEMELVNVDDDTEACNVAITGRIVSHSGSELSPASWKRIVGFDPEEWLFAKYSNYTAENMDEDCGEAALRNWCAMDIGLGLWSATTGRYFREHLVKATRTKKERTCHTVGIWTSRHARCIISPGGPSIAGLPSEDGPVAKDTTT